MTELARLLIVADHTCNICHNHWIHSYSILTDLEHSRYGGTPIGPDRELPIIRIDPQPTAVTHNGCFRCVTAPIHPRAERSPEPSPTQLLRTRTTSQPKPLVKDRPMQEDPDDLIDL